MPQPLQVTNKTAVLLFCNIYVVRKIKEKRGSLTHASQLVGLHCKEVGRADPRPVKKLIIPVFPGGFKTPHSGF